MITIRPPLKLTAQRFRGTLPPDLAEKIRGNYQLLCPGIRAEELLHVAAAAPEVYFAEGGGISIQNQIQNENQQELRLEVINHLVNRILISGTENFRYQDTVYVSNILRRLGIRQENHFLRLVRQLQEEKQENKRLIELYEDHRTLLSLLAGEEPAQKKEEAEKEAEETSVERADYFLQEEIYQRLETKQIYQDIQNFSHGLQSMSFRIFQSEIQVAEQSALIQQFRLNELKQQVFHREQPLTYYHVNEYEMAGEEEATVEAARDRLSAAVLLNLVDQAYTLRQEQIEQDSHRWYSVAGALFQSVENTWQRYSSYHQEGRRAGARLYELQVQMNQERQQEQRTIEQIVERLSVPEAGETGQNSPRPGSPAAFRLPDSIQREIPLSGGSYHGTPEALQLSYRAEESGAEGEDGTGTEEAEENAREPEPLTAERLQEQLAAFNERNIENLKRMTEISARQPIPVKRTLNRERAKTDLLRAMEHPEEVLQEYLAADQKSRQEQVREELEQEIYNLFSEETKEIYRRYLEQRDGQPIPLALEKPEPSVQKEEPESDEEEAGVPERERVVQETKERIREELRTLENQKERSEKEEQIREELRQVLVYLQEPQAARRLWQEGTGQPVSVKGTPDQEKAQIELLRTAEASGEEPQEALAGEQESRQVQIRRELEQEVFQLFSGETKEIYRRYLEQRGREPIPLALEKPEPISEGSEPETEEEEPGRLRKEERLVKETRERIREELRTLERQSERSEKQERIREELRQALVYLQEPQAIRGLWQEAANQPEQGRQPLVYRNQEELAGTDGTEPGGEPPSERAVLRSEVIREAGERIQEESRIQTERVVPTITQIVGSELVREFTSLQERTPVPLYQRYQAIWEEAREHVEEAAEAASVIQRESEPAKQAITEQLIEQTIEKRLPAAARELVSSRSVSLVHKEEERQIDEELLETIRQRTQATRREESHEERTIQKSSVTETRLQEATNQIRIEQTENVEELIRQKLQQNLGRISDQVYGRIEKRLQTERKRRGI